MTMLPPERDLPGADRMVEEIIAGVEPVRTEAPSRRPWVILGAAAAVALVVGGVFAVQGLRGGTSPAEPAPPTVTATPPTGAPTPATPTASPSAEPSETPQPSETATPQQSETASPNPGPTETATPVDTSDRPTGPVTLTAVLGETVRTRYFDVTVKDLTADGDGTAWAADVTVCYVAPQPDANADGTTRTSTDPWFFEVIDGETGKASGFHGVAEFPPSENWSPRYQERLLKVGECNSGWVAVAPGNPDLVLPTLRYSPADFGDEILWRFPH
ncbi:hypothetical protein BW730_09480 [Tessaracoccus aquimaris]|uniref:Uncharacterized protein n=1 Tax=Tessaracoccus aquimaris TaxID=1332264 RepID=A0A1Q2CNK3_9ACTN|nr:hypothetical protein [Tessaracoccus aquimaris]AQP47688.1 hypothetical protein BW730_09480 [Tessaracoccus aquimaris]